MGKSKVVRRGSKQAIVLPLLFVVVGLVFWFIMQSMNYGKTADSIEYIAQHINSRGEIVDWQNNIGVSSIDDIKLFNDGGEITIEYGKILLTWKSMDSFLEQDNINNLKRILITVKRNKKTGNIKLYWKDEEIQRWVR